MRPLQASTHGIFVLNNLNTILFRVFYGIISVLVVDVGK